MKFNGVALNTQIAIGNNTKNVQAIDGLVLVSYSYVDGHTHETTNDTKTKASIITTKPCLIYRLEAGSHSIEATQYCKVLCQHCNELKWFTLFEIPADAKIVTSDGSYYGKIKSKREGQAVALRVDDYNTFVANGFIVSNYDGA